MTSPMSREVPDVPTAHPLRLYLPGAIPGRPRACFDGAWWPYSDDLGCQAVDLSRVVSARWNGRVERMTYDPSIWALTGRRLARPGPALRMGWFRSSEPYEVTLVMVDRRRVELVVVPPATSPAGADWMMRRAVARGSVAHGKELIRLAGARAPEDRDPWDC